MLSDFEGPGGEVDFRRCDLYSCDDGANELTATTPEDAVEDYLSDAGEPPLKVYGYRRRALEEIESALNPEHIVEEILEALDDEYGGGEEANVATPAMLKAAEALVAAIRADYKVWQCERTHSATWSK